MSDYRIVGTFNVTTTKTLSGSNKLKIEAAKKPENPLALSKARDITDFFSNYQPVNIYSTYTEHRGAIWGNIRLVSGSIWNDATGQRIIIEASAHRVIFYKHGGTGGKKIYIQQPSGFITDVTFDVFISKTAERTQATKRLGEWEIHFLVGFLAGSHWFALVTVIAGDILQQVFGEKKRNEDYREASKEIIEVNTELKDIAPVFRGFLLAVLIQGVMSKSPEEAKTFIRSLGEEMYKDDKTTGRIAGAIFAKFLVNPKNKQLTFLFIFFTIGSQMATKSLSKVPPAAGAAFGEAFDSLAPPDLLKLDPNDPGDQQKLIKYMTKTMDDLGVKISPVDAIKIFEEIRKNPDKIAADMQKLSKAFVKLKNAGKSQ